MGGHQLPKKDAAKDDEDEKVEIKKCRGLAGW